VALYPATGSTGKLKCHTINRKTGNRIKEEVVDSVTHEPVDKEDRVKGCEAAKDLLVPIEEDELQAIRLESTHTINIESFVHRSEVDERYFEKPYYLAPEDKVSREAFAVIRDAMREKNVVGLARLVHYRRERIVLLQPLGKGIMATLLRSQDEVRSPTAVFEDIADFDAPPDMRMLAAELIERARAPFDPAKFEDRYEEALVALVRSKGTGLAGAPTNVAAPSAGSNVVNLMDALKRSIEAEAAGKKAADKPKRAVEAAARVEEVKAKPDARIDQATATPKAPSRATASRKGASAKVQPMRKAG